MSQAGLVNVQGGGGGGSPILTITGNDGIAVSPVANNIFLRTENSTIQFLNTGGGNQIFLDFGDGTAGNILFGSIYTLLSSGMNNSSLGKDALGAISSGNANIAIGFNSLGSVETGSQNIGIGFNAGTDYTNAESSNIVINNLGVNGESNVIRIGTQGSGAGQQNKCFIAGIVGNTVTNAQLVTNNSSTGQMGVVTSVNNGILVTSSSGSPSLLANGTTGQVLTASTGSSPSWASPASQFTPNSVLQIFDDFTSFSGNSVTGLGSESFGQIPWTKLNNAFKAVNATSSAHPGICGNPSLTSNDASLIAASSTNSVALLPIILGAGTLSVTWVINLAILSNSTNRYTLRCGLGDTQNADQANGVYFEYSDNINSGNWNVKTASASTVNTLNTAVAATSAWHNLTAVVNANGTSVTFFIDGVAQTAQTSDIPITAISPFIDVIFSAGTIAANSVLVDLFYLTYSLTTPR